MPPLVTAVHPAPGARNVPTDASLVFQFSEWIDRAAARNPALLSPPLPGGLRAEVKGDRLLLRPASGGLRPNTAYQATVLGTVHDLRGNALGNAFTLRFSTGETFDSATVAGRILHPEGKGVLIAALYRMEDRAAAEPLSTRDTSFRPGATPAPWRELPAFITAADSGGFFAFDSVRQGEYALFAFEDLNGNHSFNAGIEAAATGTLSLPLRPRGPGQFVRLAPLDTLPLRVPRAGFLPDTVFGDSADRRVAGLVRLEFSRAPHPARAAEASRYRLLSEEEEEEEGGTPPVTGAAWSPLHEAWVLETAPLREGGTYRVEVRGRPDFPGRAGAGSGFPDLDTSAAFTVEAPADSVEWQLKFTRAGAMAGVDRAADRPLPGRTHSLAGDRPLPAARWNRLKERLQVLMHDTVAVSASVRRTGPVSFLLELAEPLPPAASITLRLPPEGEDSVATQLVSTRAADTANWGRIRFLPPPALREWTFRLRETGTAPVEHHLERSGDSVTSGRLGAGNYRLLAFEDRDGDGAWHPGSLRPWISQEPQVEVLDSVAVQSGEPADLTERIADAWSAIDSVSRFSGE